MTVAKDSVLICVSGLETEQIADGVMRHIPPSRPIVLLCVIEPIADGEPGRPGIEPADEQAAHAVLTEAQALCLQRGYGSYATTRQIRVGRPEEQIVELASDPALDIGLVVIGAGYRTDARHTQSSEKLGPVARYVLEHSPCDVLLLR